MNNSLKRIAIFASGSGSNAEKIIRYFQSHDRIQVALVLSNRPQALVLEKAQKLDVPTAIFGRQQFYDSTEVIDLLNQHHIDWVILAGFLWLVPENLIRAFPGRIVNIHPALLPKYGGKGMYGLHVHQAVVDAKEKATGITIHLVDEHYDRGEIVFQAQCAVAETDSAEDVSHKVQLLEHEHFAPVIEKLILNSRF